MDKPKQQNSRDSFFCKPSKSGAESFFVQSDIAKAKKRNVPSKNSGENECSDKKPFDKKLWRTKKYSLKHKIENWEERRKKSVLRKYHKQSKYENDQNKNKKFVDVNKLYEELGDDDDDELGNTTAQNDTAKDKKNKPKKKAHEQFLDIKEQKKQKREEFLRIKAQKEELLLKYKKEKIERYKRLNKKTKKGQPVMKERLEDLLEKIKKSVGQ